MYRDADDALRARVRELELELAPIVDAHVARARQWRRTEWASVVPMFFLFAGLIAISPDGGPREGTWSLMVNLQRFPQVIFRAVGLSLMIVGAIMGLSFGIIALMARARAAKVQRFYTPARLPTAMEQIDELQRRIRLTQEHFDRLVAHEEMLRRLEP